MSRRSLARAFLSSSLGTGLSRFLGLFRELAIARVLGAGTATDAFYMAFTIPSMFRRFVADEGLTGALIPGVAEAEEQEGTEPARRLAGRVLAFLLAVGALVCLLGILGAPWLVDLFASGFRDDPRKYALTVSLTRILMPFVVFVSLVSWCEGLLNHRDHFFVPKLAPGLVSAAMVVAVFWPGSSEPMQVVYTLAAGVLVGGAVHLAVCVPPLVRRWGTVRPRLGFRLDPRFRRLVREMGKVALIGIMAQVNVIVLRNLASALETGSVTWYWNATRLVDFTQGIIAVGVGSAMLPAVARAVAGEDWGAFQEVFRRAVLLAASLLLPAATLVALLAFPLVAVLYRHGAYRLADVHETASALQLLVPYMLALAGIQIVKKPFFALNRRNALLAVGAVGVVTTWGFGRLLCPRLGVDGLALALSLSTVTQLVLYLVVLQRISEGHLALGRLLGPLGRMAVACAPAGAIAWGIGGLGSWEAGPTPATFGLLAGMGVAGGGVYLGMAHVLGVQEVRDVFSRFARRAG